MKKFLFCSLLALTLSSNLAYSNNWNPYDENGNVLRTERDATGKNAVVSTARYEASKIGLDVLKQGGNAIDAAVAVGFALGVCEPQSSGIGGGGFMIIRFAKTGETKFIDFREIAPKKSTPDMWILDKDGNVIGDEKEHGGKSIGVPGAVKGFLYALDKYGNLSRKDVIQPAVDLANNGYKVSAIMNMDMNNELKLIQQYPETAKIYLKDNKPYNVGDTLKNPDLAKTMEKIIKDGEKAFYEGEIAEAIVKSTNKANGIMSLEDLKNYDIRVNEPVSGTYRGYEILTSAPPSSGGAHIIQILNILENYNLKDVPAGSTKFYHLLSESMKMAFADRAKFMGDTEFIKIPLKGVIDKDYAKTLKDKIDMTKSQDYSEGDPWKFESKDTTHYSIIDKEGNIVAVTNTVNGVFASGVVAEGTGILLNNEMDDFDTGHGKANSIEAFKKPLSSMSPTIILKDGKPVASLGGLGAQKIITGIAQVIIQLIDYEKDIQEAIDFPRIHDAYGTLTYEGRIDKNVIAELKALGHELKDGGEWLEYPCIQGVTIKDGVLRGGADPRRDGKALGF
ncbi:MAG: gamma-glutamyltransferase [Fusobacterium gastrosuis]|uniref:gamma-glutamyltransferase n=1 Tax=Fusobacterium gastrosuis TaxID=1755100 RepID=UPI002A9E449B|nr:gamma-glutamyltransferase [Fusobacteriaceae bacterium]MDY5795817.1 gamma-glutamyltransferase [Fusobacterium gastrosuis]